MFNIWMCVNVIKTVNNIRLLGCSHLTQMIHNPSVVLLQRSIRLLVLICRVQRIFNLDIFTLILTWACRCDHQ